MSGENQAPTVQSLLSTSRLLQSSPSDPEEADTVPSADKRIQQAREFETKRNKLFNPTRFQQLDSDAFPPRPELEAMLEGLHTHYELYRKVPPQGCPEDVVRLAEADGDDIHAALYMVIRLRKTLLDTTTPTRVKISSDMHGGGGVCITY
jgi:hypothetical protein